MSAITLSGAELPCWIVEEIHVAKTVMGSSFWAGGRQFNWILLTCLLVFISACASGAYVQGDPEFRAFWVDAWGVGVLNQSQVDNLLGVPGTPQKGQIRDANCNAVIVQVRRNCDANYPSSMGEPYMSGLDPADFNALQAVINAAHDTTGGKKRVEVHAWIVAFRTSGGALYGAHSDPPTGNLMQLDNYWPSRDNTGAEVGDKAIDPGHPKAAEYTVNVAMDIVNNFDVDAIHYDYIRFTANNQGYNPTSVARYNARYGLTGQPNPKDEQWKQWRRDQVTAVVRKTYAKIQSVKPWVQLSGAFVTWNPSPVASTREAFKATRPYYDVYSDWDAWVQEGILDAAVPMTYYNWASLPNDYIKWMNFEKDRPGNRHMYIGPGTYLNSLSNAIAEFNMTRDASPTGNYAHGFCGYSYRVPYDGGNWAGFATRMKNEVTPVWADIPAMNWKSSPTKGHISGTVTVNGTNAWLDGATVQITGPEERTMLTDGTGFYAFIDLTPGIYTITVSKTGAATAQRQVTVGLGQVVGNMYVNDFAIGCSPIVYDVEVVHITDNTATIAWKTDVPASSQVQYGLTESYGQITPVDATLSTSHLVILTGLTNHTLYHFRAVSANAVGTGYSGDHTFSSGSGLLNVVPAPSAGGSVAGGGWHATGASVSVSANAYEGFFFQGWSTTPGAAGIISTANPYQFAMPLGDLTLYAIFQSSIGDIIVESMPGGKNYDCYQDFNFAVSSVKSSAIGCTPGISSRYSSIGGTVTDRSAHYRPNIPVDGSYQVWATWAKSTNGGSNIRHTVYHRDGEYTKNFNQASNDNKWNYIGEFPFLAGASGSGAAELKQWASASQSGKRIMADAVKWVYIGPFKAINPQPADKSVEIPPSNPTLSWSPGGTTGTYDVYFGTSPTEMEKVSSSQTSTSISMDVLTSTTTYYWRVDSSFLGKTTTGDIWQFTTAAVPPSVSNIEVTGVTSSSAVITWDTDQLATTQVQYGTEETYGSTTPKDTTLKRSHSVTLTGLSANTVYHFRVKSENSLAMIAVSPDHSFATKPESLTFIIDNPEGAATGAWTSMTDTGGWPETASQYVYSLNMQSATTAFFTWTPNIPVTGKYNVYCWYKAGADRTTSARYTIAHANGQMAVAIINQAKTGSQWVPIATNKQFTKGTSGFITLTNKTGETDGARKVIADAIKFEYAEVDTTPPSVPENLVAIAASTSSIDLTWNEAQDDYALTGYKVYRNGQIVGITTEPHFNDKGLVANTRYTYSVLAYDATGNESERCAGVNRYTLAPAVTAANITCDRSTDTAYTTPGFKFSNPGLGEGKVSTYRYVWNNSPSHTWTDTEAQWNDSTLTATATSVGAWYFHARGYNGDGISSGSVDLGPYYYGSGISSIAAATNNPDGTVVQITQYMIISATFNGRFYIQEENRTRGLRCDAHTVLPVGTRVKIKGTLATDNGERYLTNVTIVESVAGTAPRPFMMRTNGLGGASPNQYTPGFSNNSNIFNAGLLVRVAGRVKSIGSGYCVISDGTGGALTVRSTKTVSVGAFIGATGVVVPQGSVCELRTRSQSDVTVYLP